MNFPPPLRPGDTIRVISPSWFGGESFVRRAMRGVRTLESAGFRVEIGDHAFGNRGHVSGTVAERIADLHAAFADDHVNMVLATIGGTHAMELLPHIDFDLIRANPKIYCGFSDNTILHTAFRVEAGLPTLYGPGLITDWAEFPAMPEVALKTAIHLMTSTDPLGRVPVAAAWTDEFLDWETGEDETRERVQHANPGWVWIRRGSARGRTIGGCLETLQHLRGTRWWPEFDGDVLCLELSEECQNPLSGAEMLFDYRLMSAFDRIAGLLVARPYGFNDDQHAEWLERLADVVAPYEFPVVANMDFGHTTPMIAMPLGVMAEIKDDTVQIVEPLVRSAS